MKFKVKGDDAFSKDLEVVVKYQGEKVSFLVSEIEFIISDLKERTNTQGDMSLLLQLQQIGRLNGLSVED